MQGPPEITKSMSLDDVLEFCMMANKLLFAQTIAIHQDLMSLLSATPGEREDFSEVIEFWNRYLEKMPGV